MNEIDIVNTPSLNTEYYLQNIEDYIIRHLPDAIEFAKVIIGHLVALSFIVSIMLFIGIIYSIERLKQIRRKEEEIYNPKVEIAYEEVVKGDNELAKKWDKIKTHIESENGNDWRQAILEADIILGELLTRLGYKGEGIGEQLKRANKSDFKTLDDAWEAHKIRNRVAHDGSDFVLTKSEAKRVIDLYRKVLEEFFYL